MFSYPKCRDCGRTMRRITLAIALRRIVEPPAELRSRPIGVPTFACPHCQLVAVLHVETA